MNESDEFDIRQIAQKRQMRRAFQGRASVDQLLELTNNEPRRNHKKHNSAGDFQSNRIHENSLRKDSDIDIWGTFSKGRVNGGRNLASEKPEKLFDNLPGLITDNDVSAFKNLKNTSRRSNVKSSLIFQDEMEPALNQSNLITNPNLVGGNRRPSLSTSLVSSLPFEDDHRTGRMQVPPFISCECNGIEASALIDTSSCVSMISSSFTEKARLCDDIIREVPSFRSPFIPQNVEIIGRLKYLELYIGDNLHITELYVVDHSSSDVTLGTDFLKKSQAVIDLENGYVTFGGKQKKQKVSFLSNKQALLVSKINKLP